MRSALARGGLVVLATGLLAVFGCLLVIGDPPGIRHDALWVNEHRETVRLAIAALAVALLATIGAASESRYRLPSALVWLAAVLAAWRWFSDPIEIIARVVINRAG